MRLELPWQRVACFSNGASQVPLKDDFKKERILEVFLKVGQHSQDFMCSCMLENLCIYSSTRSYVIIWEDFSIPLIVCNFYQKVDVVFWNISGYLHFIYKWVVSGKKYVGNKWVTEERIDLKKIQLNSFIILLYIVSLYFQSNSVSSSMLSYILLECKFYESRVFFFCLFVLFIDRLLYF